MYCDKTSVNILSALLLEHGIQDIVVCPGARNAALVHNFHKMSLEACMTLYPVTDERCAAFVACGLYYDKRRPVAVCVTSGTALLNTLPAVAEAYYQHIPLLVISADRPAEAIGQLDGQTLPQEGALMPYAKTIVLNENNVRWCERACNEALLALRHDGGCPVHLNLPISRPLFNFNVEHLPTVKKIEEFTPKTDNETLPKHIIERICNARLPLLVVGQLFPKNVNDTRSKDLHSALDHLESTDGILIMPEIISNCNYSYRTVSYEYSDEQHELKPDLVLHIGGNFVHKRLRKTLREQECPVVRIEERQNDFPDTFYHLDTIVRCSLAGALSQLANRLEEKQDVVSEKAYFKGLLCKERNDSIFCEAGAMALVSEKIQNKIQIIHLGNSSAVRQASHYFEDGPDFYCNRGVNGIEGTLSAAAGHALGTDEQVCVILGDLSFFYDSNALWNCKLGGNLNIIMFNNNGGGIFRELEGLDASPATEEYVSARHNTFAKGIAESYGAEYIEATDYDELASALDVMINKKRSRPIIIEITIKQ